MSEQGPALLLRTRQFWQKRSTRLLTDHDARQITSNMVGFFDVLAEWDAKEKAKAEKSAGHYDVPLRRAA